MEFSQEIVVNSDTPSPITPYYRQIRLYIPIKNDECVEDDESFSVHVFSDDLCVLFDNIYGLITILDDDGKHCHNIYNIVHTSHLNKNTTVHFHMHIQ